MRAQVLLPKVFNFSFTYNTNQKKLKLGDVVEVPFGKTKEIGVVWPGESLELKKFKIKNINKKFNNLSLNKNLINFIKWFSMYNMMPLGLVLKMVIGNNQRLLDKKDKDFNQKINPIKKFKLNKEQTNALNFLNLENDKFNVSVLQGTTGSGKTLVYFERIKKIILVKKQSLVLLPEII